MKCFFLCLFADWWFNTLCFLFIPTYPGFLTLVTCLDWFWDFIDYSQRPETFFFIFFFTDLLLPYVPFPLPKILGYIILSRSRLTHKGDRTFAVRASSLWNYLPEEIKAVNSVLSFKSLLKRQFCKVTIDLLNWIYSSQGLLLIYSYL